jgi:hypothetical protein
LSNIATWRGIKAIGWTHLRQTKGYRRNRQGCYLVHERPKQLWVRELRPRARTILRGVNLPQALREVESRNGPECAQEPKALQFGHSSDPKVQKQTQSHNERFYDFRAAKQQQKAFSLVTVSKSPWLPP